MVGSVSMGFDFQVLTDDVLSSWELDVQVLLKDVRVLIPRTMSMLPHVAKRN